MEEVAHSWIASSSFALKRAHETCPWILMCPMNCMHCQNKCWTQVQDKINSKTDICRTLQDYLHISREPIPNPKIELRRSQLNVEDLSIGARRYSSSHQRKHGSRAAFPWIFFLTTEEWVYAINFLQYFAFLIDGRTDGRTRRIADIMCQNFELIGIFC